MRQVFDEPPVRRYEEGTGTRPDFRLSRGTDYIGAVEVLTLFERDEWDKEGRRHTWLEDELNRRLSLTTHSLTFEVRSWQDTPSVKHIVRWLESAVAALQADPEALDRVVTGTPEKVYARAGTTIAFQFLQLPPGYLVAHNAPAAIGGAAIGGLIDSATRLRDRLDDKAGKYQLDGRSLAFVVGARDTWCTVDEIHEALTGTPVVIIATRTATRLRNGFFGIGHEHPAGKRPQVSTVFSLHDWFPGEPYLPRITRFDNPFASSAFPHDALPHHGHWGVHHRRQGQVRADWLLPPTGPAPAPAV